MCSIFIYFLYYFPKSVEMYKSDITIAITSCGRYELLKKNIESIEQSISLKEYKKVLTEDSKDEKHIQKMKDANEHWFLKWWKIIYTGWSGQDDVLKCHYYALKTLYEEITTKYVFHCEDDQLFYKVDYDFMLLSYNILELRKDIAIVILRDLYKDYGIKKEWLTRGRYYDILSDREENLYGHAFIYGNPNAICSLQPWLRITKVIKKAMFEDNDGFVNEATMSRNLTIAGYTGIYIKKWIYYNPNWRWNSTRISHVWFIQYAKKAVQNAIEYRTWLIIKYIRFLFSHQ